ncbi:hypothetical protein TCAP_07238 [Tolypocladium capitatum]|uniref:Uncharacterized protein n=1 Tax=Tolypocladium capitatum TaxID=45235 RepID=A0A2K3Q213_9HYPO|nr:hypothetical protein TCAP_07238 [Tolypocladium capitatum]
MAQAADAASLSVETRRPAGADASLAAAPDARKGRDAAGPKRDYKGFVAGVFSGIAKLTGNRPPLRHGQGAPADDGREPLQRPAAVRGADGAARGPARAVQGRDAAARGLDVHGLGHAGLADGLSAAHGAARLWRVVVGAGRGRGRRGVWLRGAAGDEGASFSHVVNTIIGIAGIAGNAVPPPPRPRPRRHPRRRNRQLHRRPRRARQGPAADPVRGAQVAAPVLGPARLPGAHPRAPRPARHLPRPLRDAALPQLLLLLVEQLRRAVARAAATHAPRRARHQLLGRRAERPGVLADELPERPGQAAHHDGSAGRRAGRRHEEVPAVEGRGDGRVQGKRVEGVLEGFSAVLPQGVSRERGGARGL